MKQVAEVIDIEEPKIRHESKNADAMMVEQNVSFQDVSALDMRVEDLRIQYSVSANNPKSGLISELYNLNETASEDHQLVTQGNPVGRDMSAFGDAVVRLARREQIMRKLTPA